MGKLGVIFQGRYSGTRASTCKSGNEALQIGRQRETNIFLFDFRFFQFGVTNALQMIQSTPQPDVREPKHQP